MASPSPHASVLRMERGLFTDAGVFASGRSSVESMGSRRSENAYVCSFPVVSLNVSRSYVTGRVITYSDVRDDFSSPGLQA